MEGTIEEKAYALKTYGKPWSSLCRKRREIIRQLLAIKKAEV